ncbi:MAG: DUF504 domain-containing protein [Methanomicrobiaceae archaeon]|nr:DUF504 domain-containing protein [Methanomicrobiaceae archaeon]
MRTSHSLLLRIWHDPEYDIKSATVEYADRGAPGDISVVGGNFIKKLDRDWFEVETKKGIKIVPYHRIKKIIYDGIPLFEI